MIAERQDRCANGLGLKGRPLWFACLLVSVCLASGTAEAGDPPAASVQAEVQEVPPPPPTGADIRASIRRGVDFLVADQNTDGSWGSPHQTKGLNIYAPAPGAHHAFRTAVTAMAVSALIESGLSTEDPRVKAALEKGEANLLEELPRVRRATADAIYNVWTHGYGLQALVRMHHRAGEAGDTARQSEIVQVMHGQIDRLTRYESVDGGWGYYDFRVGSQRPASSAISFTTATILVAFKESEALGVDVPDDVIKRALDSVQRQRKDDNSYLYGEYLKARPMYGINRPGGSLGRSQACNYALRIWGDDTITNDVLVEWLRRLKDRNGWLDIGRKRPVPHESWFAVAGYFFYYGHYYASLCIEDLPEESAAPLRGDLATILLNLQEQDGDWWDYPLYNYHRQYGTAFAIMSLTRCLPATPDETETAQAIISPSDLTESAIIAP